MRITWRVTTTTQSLGDLEITLYSDENIIKDDNL